MGSAPIKNHHTQKDSILFIQNLIDTYIKIKEINKKDISLIFKKISCRGIPQIIVISLGMIIEDKYTHIKCKKPIK
jgi:hypothetical protein